MGKYLLAEGRQDTEMIFSQLHGISDIHPGISSRKQNSRLYQRSGIRDIYPSPTAIPTRLCYPCTPGLHAALIYLLGRWRFPLFGLSSEVREDAVPDQPRDFHHKNTGSAGEEENCNRERF